MGAFCATPFIRFPAISHWHQLLPFEHFRFPAIRLSPRKRHDRPAFFSATRGVSPYFSDIEITASGMDRRRSLVFVVDKRAFGISRRKSAPFIRTILRV